MNANLTLSEILTIAFIMLLVFGPHRLPEMARKAGEWVGKAREMANSVKQELSGEFEDISKPLTDLNKEISSVRSELTSAVPDLKTLDTDLPTETTPTDDAPTEPAVPYAVEAAETVDPPEVTPTLPALGEDPLSEEIDAARLQVMEEMGLAEEGVVETAALREMERAVEEARLEAAAELVNGDGPPESV